MLFAGCRAGEAEREKRALANALRYGNAGALNEAGKRLIEKHPERKERIEDGLSYLYQNLDAIVVRYRDPEARNGGATEPHVSHVLSSRLSSRPMGWSIRTLEHLVPILAAETFELIPRTQRSDLLDCLSQAAEKATVTLNRRPRPFLVDPDQCASFQVVKTGRITQLYHTMKGLSR